MKPVALERQPTIRSLGKRIGPAIGTRARHRTRLESRGTNGVSNPSPQCWAGCASITPLWVHRGLAYPTSFVSRTTKIGLGARLHNSRYWVVLGYTRRNMPSDANVVFLAERSTIIGFVDEAVGAGTRSAQPLRAECHPT